MLFDILEYAGLQPSIISGAGLINIIKQGKIGNAKVGAGEWLVIEADESDGSIVQYKPEIGLLLNVDKDHQEIDELMRILTYLNRTVKYLSSINPRYWHKSFHNIHNRIFLLTRLSKLVMLQQLSGRKEWISALK